MIALSKTQTNYIYFIFIAIFFLAFTFSNNNIILKGKINSKVRYSIDVVYEAQKDSFFVLIGILLVAHLERINILSIFLILTITSII